MKLTKSKSAKKEKNDGPWIRNCPKCGDVIKYPDISKYNRAIKRNSGCVACRNKTPIGMSSENWVRLCSGCRVEIKYTTLSQYNWAVKNDRKCTQGCGRKKYEYATNSDGKYIIPCPQCNESRSIASKSNAARALRENNKCKSCVQLNLKHVMPRYNPEACRLFDQINAEFNWNGVHAENGGEFSVGRFFVDFYEPTHNIVIEFDEDHHREKFHINKDKIRQNKIVDTLKCKFIRISKWEKDTWKQIIEQF